MMKELFIEDTVVCNVEVSNWEEAVITAGELMLKAGAVEERYLGAMIEVTKELGPYCVIAPGIALPHARPEDGVIKNCFCLVTLKNPVEFNSHNDPVKMVVAFAAIDKEEHIKTLERVAIFLQNTDVVEKIKTADNEMEILQILEDF